MFAVAVIAVMVWFGIEVARFSEQHDNASTEAAFKARLGKPLFAAASVSITLAIFVGRLKAKAAQFRVLAKHHDRRQAAILSELANSKEDFDLRIEVVAYHAAMGEKYLTAASHPWEYVPPDPPRPPASMPPSPD
jgi:hypothetical protein